MKKFFSLIAAVLFAGSMFAADATMTKGTNGYDDFTVNEKPAIKVGTGSKGGDMTVTVGEGATSLTVHAAAWKGVSGLVLNITAPAGVTISPASITLTAEDAFTGSDKAFTVSDEEAYKFDFAITGASAGAIFTFTTATQKRFLMWDATYEAGDAPAVAKPVIAGEEKFYDEVEVSITCPTDGAAIRYTLDGTDPTAASALYEEPFTLSESATVKAIAILGSDASAIAEKAFVKNPSFASFEALIAAGVADKTMIEVSFEGIEITHFYESTYNNVTSRKGVYFDVNEVEYEIYNSFAVISDEWEEGGKLSGTLRGEWQHYVNTSKGIDIWEVVPKADGWSWDELTYEAPSATAIDNTNAAVKAVKVVRDGVLYIEKNGVLYNAQGAIVR